ncbi:MAG: DUF58 domain-containing protein [Actinomycetota bacterium]|nr:DUF58 domain-containing protein [Actinomycetota bacterium]
MRAFAPTARAAGALAAIGVAVLVVPAWLAAAAAILLVAAAAVDARSVRKPPALARALTPVLSRGVAAPLRIQAVSADGRRVLLRQPASPALEVTAAVEHAGLSGHVVPHVRGRHRLAPVASASIGPLGLARVHHPLGSTAEVRVYPNLVAATALIARLRRQLAGHPGRLARGPLGLGTDFEMVREYTPDDDVRQLNWRASARMGRPMSNQYRLERDRDLLCLLDTGRLMANLIGTRTMLDAALDAVTVLAMAADELGDRCGAIAFDERVRTSLAPAHLGGRRVIEALFDAKAAAGDSDFELAFGRVGRSRRALAVVFTDLVDEAAARSLIAGAPMLARRHAVVVASAIDPQLHELAARLPGSQSELEAMLVALDVLEARAAAAARLRHAGVTVLEAPAQELSERCLDAYLRAKARARL